MTRCAHNLGGASLDINKASNCLLIANGIGKIWGNSVFFTGAGHYVLI